MEMGKLARRKMALLTIALLLSATIASPTMAGPCDSPGCEISEINAWADELVELIRGPIHIDFPEAGDASFGTPIDVLGPASNIASDAVSLGDGGSVIVGFEEAIYDGPDFDLAVFENGISSGSGEFIFLELGFVEVSSDGISFARFPSLTSRITPVGGFEEVLPADYANLASTVGKGFGTGFDLADLSSHPLVSSGAVDLDDIHYVRIEDVVGNGSRLDSMNNPIYDPFPTGFSQCGFDLNAVGAINVPEPGSGIMLISGWACLLLLERRRRTDLQSSN